MVKETIIEEEHEGFNLVFEWEVGVILLEWEKCKKGVISKIRAL